MLESCQSWQALDFIHLEIYSTERDWMAFTEFVSMREVEFHRPFAPLGFTLDPCAADDGFPPSGIIANSGGVDDYDATATVGESREIFL